jgi:hypothetical protein
MIKIYQLIIYFLQLIFFQMLRRHLVWFLYRRRNKLIIIVFILFTIIFFFYESQNDSSATYTTLINKPKRDFFGRKIRINRETYVIPEPCRKCPGEYGSGVTLNVIINK